MKKFVFLLLSLSLFLNSYTHAAPGDPGQEPLGEAESKSQAVVRAMAIGTTYGILAGAFLGVATIAFVEKPSDNLKNIAVGASLGLYAGILFGGYLAWATFSEDRPVDLPTEEDYDSLDYETFHSPFREKNPLDLPKLQPTISFSGTTSKKEYDSLAFAVPILNLKF